MRRLLGALLLSFAGIAHADEAPGEFDYWMLALSWSPQHCADQHSDPQCLRPNAFVVHGLWPQYEDGYPDFCGDTDRVGRDLVERMLPLMPSEKLIQHQWRKHGSCSGMPVDEYFLTVERAHRALAIPASYSQIERYEQSTIADIEKSFIDVNPGLTGDGIALQCAGRWLKEMRVCFDKQFEPRACGSDIVDKCGEKVVLRPVRGAGAKRPR